MAGPVVSWLVGALKDAALVDGLSAKGILSGSKPETFEHHQ